MAQESDLAAQEPEVIRQQIEETRSSLTQKLETLEHEVKETVTGAKEAVTDTVEAVKETVESTVENVKETVAETVCTVKRTFDLRYQVDQHPWGMMGGSFAAGLIAGMVIPTPVGRRAHEAGDLARDLATSRSADTYRPMESAVSEPPRRNGKAESREPGLLSTLAEKFEPELNQLKGLAIGTTLSFLRDLLTQSMEARMATQVRGVIDSITTKLGGQPIEGPVLESLSQKYPEESRS
jgi:ElaB/YqjD/DUF883 family membrane-anchored ribosome-binding protein